MRYLSKIWFKIFSVFCFFLNLNSDPFTDAYLAIDSALWTAKINGSMDPNAKGTLRQNLVTLTSQPGLQDWQKTRISSLVTSIQSTTAFSSAEIADYVAVLSGSQGSQPAQNNTQTSVATVSTTQVNATGYQTVATRLSNISVQVSQAKNATDISTIIASLNALLPEYYGSEKDRGVFSMILDSLMAPAKFYSVSTTPITTMKTKLQNVLLTDKISFLERINNPNTFIDTNEKALFLTLINNLRENLSKLDAPSIVRFHTTLTTAYARTNFTDDEKKVVMMVANEAVDVYNSVATTTSSDDEQENFANLLSSLSDNYTSMNNLYKQGDQTTALSRKSTDFYTPLTSLQTTYLGDMFLLGYLSLPSLTKPDGTVFSLPALKRAISNEQQTISDLLDSVLVGSRLFTNDSNKISDIKKTFTDQVTAEVKIKYLEDASASPNLSSENKKRFLYHLLYLISGMNTTDPLRAVTYEQNIRIKTLLNSFSKDQGFSSFKDELTALIALQQLASQNITIPQGATVSGAVSSSGVAISSNPSLLASMPNGSKVVFSLGKSDSFTQRYLCVKRTNNNYSIKALQTNALDPAAQFSVIVQTTTSQLVLESVKYPGMIIAYSPEKMSFSEDLDLVPKPTTGSYTNQQLFFIVSSKLAAGKICLVNSACGGYLSAMSDGTILATNFFQGNSEMSSSQFSSYVLNQSTTTLTTLFSSNLSVPDKTTSIINYLKTLNNADIIPIALREVYNWTLLLRKNPTDWQLAVSSGAAQKLSNFLSSLLTGSAKKIYQPLNNFIVVLKSVLEFSPNINFSIMPNDREIFWLTEPSFSFQANVKIGFSIAFKTNGCLNVFLSKSTAPDEKKYQIKIGDTDDGGNRIVRLLKDNQIVLEAPCKDFDKDNFVEYQTIFEAGNISLYSTSGQIINYQNDGDLLIDPTSPTELVVLGLSSDNDTVTCDQISAGLDMQYLYIVQQITSEPYATNVNRVIKNISTERSVSDFFLKTLNEIIDLCKTPKKLYGKDTDWNSLKTSLLSLKTQPFVVKNYTANTNIDLALKKLGETIPRDQQKAFVLSLIEVLSFYHSFPAKQDAAEIMVQNVVSDNLLRLTKMSSSDTEKNEVTNILNGKISTEGLFSNDLIGMVQDAIAAQDRLNATGNLNLDGKINLFLDFASKLKTIDQRTNLLTSIDQAISEITSTNLNNRAALANSIKKFQDCLTTISNLTLFKDILGSLDYFNFSLQNFTTLEDQLNSIFTVFLANSSMGDKFILDLTTIITNFTTMLQRGLDPLHGPVSTRILAKLASIRQNARVGQFVNKIDFLTNYIQVQGKLSNVIDSLRKKLLNIKKLLDRDAFFADIDTGLVSYIETQIQSGSVNENDRSLAKSFLTELSGNQWFRDTTGISKLQDLGKRLDGQANPIIGLTRLTSQWSNLAGNDSVGFDAFLKNLEALSLNFRNYIASGGSVATADINSYNNFIDSLISSSNTETNAANSSFAAAYLLYLKRFQSQPNYNLSDLKLDVSGDIDLLSSANTLLNQLTSTDFSVLANRQKLLTDFNALVDKWKLFVIFDPSKLNTTGSSLRKFYDLMSNFFDVSSKNVLLIPNLQTFSNIRQDMLEDQFTPLEKATVFKNFLLASGLGTKSAQQAVDALSNLVNDFKNYQKLHIAMPDTELNQMIDLLDLAKNKSELSTFTTKINDLKTLVQTTPDIKSRVDFINNQLSLSLNSATSLSDVQKDNLVTVCSTIHNVLKALTPDNLRPVDMSTFQQLIANLLTKNIFVDPAKTTLQNIRDSVINLIRSIPGTTLITSTQTTQNSFSNTTPNQSSTSPTFQNYLPTSSSQQTAVVNSSPQSQSAAFIPQVKQQPATNPGYRVRSRSIDYGSYGSTPNKNPYAAVAY